MHTTLVKLKWGILNMPSGNYRSISINDELIDRVKQLIEKIGTYHSVAEFVSEAVRLRIEILEKRHKTEERIEDGS
jgi:Arc/MetJ-type ribon-helix-helix transcriptional regulator